MRQGAEDQLVETGANVTIVPDGQRVALVGVAEASEQLGRTRAPHPSYDVTASILKRSDR